MRPVSVKWLNASVNSIAASQTYATIGGTLNLNGTMAGNVPGNAGVSFLALSQSRYITITSNSATTNAGTLFTINGTYLGNPVSFEMDGPAGNATVTTQTPTLGQDAQLFDTVTSITTDDAVTSVSAGMANGRFSWILYNNHATFPSLSVEAEVSGSAGTITYRFISTLDEIAFDKPAPGITVGIVVPDGSGATPFKTVMDGTAPTTPVSTIMANTNFLYRYYTIEVTAQAAGFNGALLATFIQGGIN